MALAMLPLGVTLLIGAAIAVLLFAGLAIFGTFDADGIGLDVLWWAAGGALSVVTGRVAIAILCAFDWRPVPPLLLLWGAFAIAWPGWW